MTGVFIWLWHKARKDGAVLQAHTEMITKSFEADSRILHYEHASRMSKLEHDYSARIEEARNQAVRQSRAAMRGQATEHLAPLIMDGFSAKDFRFIGNPIDFFVVKGLSDVLDGQDNAVHVYLLEIKTGTSTLSKTQRAIRDAVVRGKVTFATFNADTGFMKEWRSKDVIETQP